MEEIRKERLAITELPSSHDPSTFQRLAKGTKPASFWTDPSSFNVQLTGLSMEPSL